MTTERQRLANQQNARKSTGPKTTTGKENSRRNALRHGLTGSGTVRTRDDDRRLKKALVTWREHLQPIDVLENTLVDRAALAELRLKRCLKKDLADLSRRKHRANKRWDGRQEKAVDQSVDLLENDPELAVAQLESISRGCDWLIDRWRELAAALDEPGCWNDPQAALAIRMCGKNPETAPMDDPSITKLRLAILAVSPEPDPDAVDAFFEESTAELDTEARTEALTRRLPDRETGKAMLLDTIEQELARLVPLKQHLWEDQDEPARQEAEDISLVDTSLAGARTLRYETANEFSLHRSVNLLIRLRKVESEQQTYDRFSKMGQDQGRYWDGKNWVPLRDEARSEKRADAESHDSERIAQNASEMTDMLAPEHPAQPSAQERYEAHVHQQASEQAAREAEPRRSDGPVRVASSGESPARNEAIFSDANHSMDGTYSRTLTGSPDPDVECPEPAQALGSAVGQPVHGNAPAREQSGQPSPLRDRLRIEANSPASLMAPIDPRP